MRMLINEPRIQANGGAARERRTNDQLRRSGSRNCLLIKNPQTGKPIEVETLREHFASEIATGATKLKPRLGNRIVAAMLGRDGGLTDELTQAKLLMLFAEHRMGWKETVADGARKRGSPPVYRQGQ
jgi:hypothetical protein